MRELERCSQRHNGARHIPLSSSSLLTFCFTGFPFLPRLLSRPFPLPSFFVSVFPASLFLLPASVSQMCSIFLLHLTAPTNSLSHTVTSSLSLSHSSSQLSTVPSVLHSPTYELSSYFSWKFSSWSETSDVQHTSSSIAGQVQEAAGSRSQNKALTCVTRGYAVQLQVTSHQTHKVQIWNRWWNMTCLLTACIRVLHNKPRAAQAIKNLPALRGTKSSSLCSQHRTTEPYPEPDKSNPRLHFNIILRSRFGLPNVLVWKNVGLTHLAPPSRALRALPITSFFMYLVKGTVYTQDPETHKTIC
jgi:hypothetical protein